MSFHEVSIAIRAENRATSVFRMVASDVMNLGFAFGALDSQTGRTVMQVFSVIRLFTTLRAVINASTVATTTKTAADQVGVLWTANSTTATHTHTLSLIAHSIAAKVTAAATWLLNASLAMKISLLTLGVGLIAATAAYMAWLATTTHDAAIATAEYNEEASKTGGRNITRAGEAAMLRRGVGP